MTQACFRDVKEESSLVLKDECIPLKLSRRIAGQTSNDAYTKIIPQQLPSRFPRTITTNTQSATLNIILWRSRSVNTNIMDVLSREISINTHRVDRKS